MGIRGSKERCLENLAFRYWGKGNNRSEEENWQLAVKLLDKLERRYKNNVDR